MPDEEVTAMRKYTEIPIEQEEGAWLAGSGPLQDEGSF
jgi:hypothetical protein